MINLVPKTVKKILEDGVLDQREGIAVLTSYVTFRLDCNKIVGNFGWLSAVNHKRKLS